MITRKLIENKIKNNLRLSSQNITKFRYESVRNILILVDIEEYPEYLKLTNLGNCFPWDVKIKLLCFTSDNTHTQDDNSNPLVKTCTVHKKAYDFLGNPKSGFIKKILKEDYNLVINYFKKGFNFMLLLSTSFKSDLRVGFPETNEAFNDLILDIEMKDLDKFEKEMMKYIKILNQ